MSEEHLWLTALWSTIFFLSLVGLILYSFFKKQQKENMKKPVLERKAKVVLKNVSIIVFEFENGERESFYVKEPLNSTILENDIGLLKNQGTAFIEFKRDIQN